MTLTARNYKFYINFVVLFLVICVSIFLLSLFKVVPIDNSVWLCQHFFLFIWLISHFISEKGLNDKSSFHIYYMGSMGVRFLLSLIFIFVTLYYYQQNPVIFIVAFFLLYLVYTSFEIYFLLCILRTDFKADGTKTSKY